LIKILPVEVCSREFFGEDNMIQPQAPWRVCEAIFLTAALLCARAVIAATPRHSDKVRTYYVAAD
jgi:hypothetical protein